MSNAELIRDTDHFFVCGVGVVGECRLPHIIERLHPKARRCGEHISQFALTGVRIGNINPTLKMLGFRVPTKLGDLSHHLRQHTYGPTSVISGRLFLHPALVGFKHNVLNLFSFESRFPALNRGLFLFDLLTNTLRTIFALVNKNRLKNKHLPDSKRNIVAICNTTVGKGPSTELSTAITPIGGG